MAKRTKENKDKEGFFYANDKFRIDIKYDGESQKQELIKFTSLDGEPIVVSAEAMLDLISRNFRIKKAALAIMDAEIGVIPMVGVLRQIYFTADKDYKKGDTITTKMLHKYPWALARLEEAFGIALQHGDVVGMPNDKYQEYLKQYDAQNIEYIKAVHSDNMAPSKTSEVTKEGN